MRITLGGLLRKYIRPEHKVVCIGTFSGVEKVDGDPSALFASYLTRKRTKTKGGSVTMVDAQARSLEEKLEQSIRLWGFKGVAKPARKQLLDRLRSLRANAGGVGDAMQCRRAIMEYAQAQGLKIKLPHVQLADLRNTGLPDKHADVLLDIGTMYWASKGKSWQHVQPDEDKVRAILEEYRRTSNTSILAFRAMDAEIQSAAETIAEKLGGVVVSQPVTNKYRIRRQRKGQQDDLVLRHMYWYQHATIIAWPNKGR